MNKKVLEDKYSIECIICMFFLSFSHFIQFFRSGFLVQPLVRGICSTVVFFVTLLSGRKHWNILLFLWAVAIMFWNRFSNYTSFILILISLFDSKAKWVYLFIYEVLVIVLCVIHRDTFTHYIIHNIGCAFFYACYYYFVKFVNFQKNKISFLHGENARLRQENKILKKNILEYEERKQKKLELTQDEYSIIFELCEGKEIKEIEMFSQNTVYVKLREARKRNNCLTNEELKTRFKADFQQ
ncbi:MAG: hypothetical protein MJ176_03435 [Treponema sp.]|nr:hypothetical protein [Treponema sp.]